MNSDLYKHITNSHPSLVRGQVWCRTCGHTEPVVTADALRRGWPKCCGQTMTIDSPEEQVSLSGSGLSPAANGNSGTHPTDNTEGFQ